MTTTATTGIALGVHDDHTPASWPACTGGLITGPAGSGKTQACLGLAEQITARVPTALHTISPHTGLDTRLRERGLDPLPARAEPLAEIVRLRRAHHLDRPQGWPTAADPLHLIVLDELPPILDHAGAHTRRAWTSIATTGPAVGVITIATAVTDHLSSFGGDRALRDALAAGAYLALRRGAPGHGTLCPTPGAQPRPVQLPRPR